MADNVYAHWAKLEKWSLHDAICLLSDYEVMSLGITGTDDFYTLKKNRYDRYEKQLRKYLRSNMNQLTKTVYIENRYDSEEDYENQNPSLDFKTSFTLSATIIKWFSESSLEAPKEFAAVLSGSKVPAKKKVPDQCKTDPAIATELGTLRNEKLKWDTSIRAAAEIGLLFYEGELPKPTTKAAFVKDFSSKVGGLPDTTVEMIYKSLPTEYKHKGGKPKVSRTESASITGIGDLNIAIKAAVYAGSIHEEREARDKNRLAIMLKENDYQVPPEAVLEKIVEYVKDV